MISHIFILTVYQPLYNALVFLMDVLPWADAGVAVVILTLVVKLALFPLSQKAIVTQIKMKAMEGEIASLKEQHKNDREAHTRATLALYKEKNVNPFSTFFLTLVQIPLIITLYYIFYDSGLPEIRTDLLYSFVSSPTVSMLFLGIINITKGSLVLALLVSISQYFQVRFAMPISIPKSSTPGGSMKDDFARTLNLQMRYFLPVFVGFISYGISGAVSLYWITSNLFAIGQEIYVRRNMAKNKAQAEVVA